ncbi:CRISPR-associated endoribonuclease Cas2 [Niallia circulans]|nr:CRISPR-associated endoribonuclease Cas2 [Niallia circulans]
MGKQTVAKSSESLSKLWAARTNSVFECIVDTAQLTALKLELTSLVDEEKDSQRIDRLGNNYKTKVEHIGAKPTLELEDLLIFSGENPKRT